MKALVCRRYGPPESLTLADLPDPVPGAGEVLLRIRAATVSSADWRIVTGTFPAGFAPLARLALGWSGPRRPIPGTDAAGEIAALGPGVTGWAVGERVCAAFGARMGGHAELRAVPASALVAAPPGLCDAEAAALAFGGLAALHFLRDRARLRPGERALVIGAAGAVGSAAVQIARLLGAEVTGVTSGEKRALVERLGAAVIDHRAGDWAAGGARWDVILDATGSLTPARARAALAPGGRAALVVATLGQMIATQASRSILTGTAPDRAEDLATLAGWAAEGRWRPVVSRTWPLAEATAAYAHVATGRKIGNVALTIP